MSRPGTSYPNQQPFSSHSSFISLICVAGATGTQGGSVCREFVNKQGWKVRGLCRNTESQSAKELRDLGIEVVPADLDVSKTFAKAFEGATAIFATGYFWHFVPQMSLRDAGEAELQQLINISNAAATIPTLQHLVLSVVPHADKVSSGRLPCAYLDFKALSAEYVKKELPQLAAKTTFLWVGFCVENFLAQENALMCPQPFLGNYLLAAPSKPSGVVPIGGVVSKNTGIITRAIIDSGSRVFNKYVPLVTNYVTMADIVSAWGETTGKTAVFAEIQDTDYSKMFGLWGTELASQFRFSEEFSSWHSILDPTETVRLEDLGVEGEVVDFYEGLQQFRSQITP